MTRKTKKTKSLTLRAMEMIRDGITSGKYPLGAPLYEKVLAEQFGISKTPVREALVRLQREGLVDVHPHSGTFVFELAEGEVAELCEFRLVLETNAVQLALCRHGARLTADLDSITAAMAQAVEKNATARYHKLDAKFHQAFFKHSGNSYLASSFEMIEPKLEALRGNLSIPFVNHFAVSLSEHEAIAKALRENRIADALDVLTEHTMRARELMRERHEALRPIMVAETVRKSKDGVAAVSATAGFH